MNQSAALKLLPLVLLLLLGIVFFPSTGRDDSYIHYWPAYTLTHFGTFVNYNGAFLQQTSGLTFTLLLAVIYFLIPVNLVGLGWLVSVLLGLLAVYLAIRLCEDFGFGFSLQAGFLTATSIPLAYWSFSGMETTLYTSLILLFLWYFVHYLKQDSTVPDSIFALVTVLLLFTRTEAPVVLLVFFLAFFGLVGVLPALSIPELNKKRRNFLLVLGTGIVLKVLFQLYYFGSILPLPLRAKVLSGEGLSILRGLQYVVYGHAVSLSVLLALLYGAVLLSVFLVFRNVNQLDRFPLEEVVLTTFLGVFLSFVIFAGGDWMEGGRFLAPVVVLLYPLIVAGLRVLNQPAVSKRILTVLVVIQIALLGLFLYNNTSSLVLWEISPNGTGSSHHWTERANRFNRSDLLVLDDLRRLGTEILKTEKTFVVHSGQGGLVPYHLAKQFFPRLEFIDRRGLVTSHLTDCEQINPHTDVHGIYLPWALYFDDPYATINRFCYGRSPDVHFGLVFNERTDPDFLKLDGIKLAATKRITHGASLLPGARTGRVSFLVLPDAQVERLDLNIRQNSESYEFSLGSSPDVN